MQIQTNHIEGTMHKPNNATQSTVCDNDGSYEPPMGLTTVSKEAMQLDRLRIEPTQTNVLTPQAVTLCELTANCLEALCFLISVIVC